MPIETANKRIALFIPSFRGGGAERAMLLFAEGLLEFGFDVDFLVAQDDGPFKNQVPAGARLLQFNKRAVSLALPELVQYLRRERPAALYSTIVNANLVAIFAKLISRSRTPLVIRESNVLIPGGRQTLRRRLSSALTPIFYRFADSIISVSDDVAAALRTAVPSLEKRIVVLPNPVVTENMFTLGQAAGLHPWLAERTPLLVGAGRLHPQKDFSTLIRAVAEVRKHRDVRLLILGEGEERGRLESLVEDLGLTGSVALCGFIDNPFPYFKRANAFVLSSIYEGMPNVLLQAMAFGTPVVATDCQSGAREVLTGTDFGRLVPAGDFGAIAEAVADCIERPKNQFAAEFVKSRFSVPSATERYLELAGIRVPGAAT